MRSATRLAAAALVAVASLTACGSTYDDDASDNISIDPYTCGLNVRGSDGSSEVDGTIAALVPSGLPAGDGVHCTGKQQFTFQGRDVFLVYVAYGKLNNCPGDGCYSSDLCAIYDQSQAQLYTAAVQYDGEQPTGVPSECHTIRDGSHASDCSSYQAPGQSHPLVQTTEFQSFRSSQQNTGPLRACFFY